jgi:hypothetical protein
MVDDAELLRRYAEEHSELAFSELAQRRLDLNAGRKSCLPCLNDRSRQLFTAANFPLTAPTC